MAEIITGEKKELESRAASLIAGFLAERVSEKGKAVLAIPGGRSVSGIFSLLPSMDLPWDKVHIFMVDERLVSLDDTGSNYRLAREAFIDLLLSQNKIPPGNIHPFDGLKADIGAYASELESLGGSFDAVLLSSGEDCHVAALYPDHHSVFDDSEYFIVMDDSPKPPPRRMSSSRKLLKRSSFAVLLFFGDSKKEAFARFNDSSLPETSCPAKIVLGIPRAFVLADRKAAADDASGAAD